MLFDYALRRKRYLEYNECDAHTLIYPAETEDRKN